MLCACSNRGHRQSRFDLHANGNVLSCARSARTMHRRDGVLGMLCARHGRAIERRDVHVAQRCDYCARYGASCDRDESGVRIASAWGYDELQPVWRQWKDALASWLRGTIQNGRVDGGVFQKVESCAAKLNEGSDADGGKCALSPPMWPLWWKSAGVAVEDEACASLFFAVV